MEHFTKITNDEHYTKGIKESIDKLQALNSSFDERGHFLNTLHVHSPLLNVGQTINYLITRSQDDDLETALKLYNHVLSLNETCDNEVLKLLKRNLTDVQKVPDQLISKSLSILRSPMTTTTQIFSPISILKSLDLDAENLYYSCRLKLLHLSLSNLTNLSAVKKWRKLTTETLSTLHLLFNDDTPTNNPNKPSFKPTSYIHKSSMILMSKVTHITREITAEIKYNEQQLCEWGVNMDVMFWVEDMIKKEVERLWSDDCFESGLEYFLKVSLDTMRLDEEFENFIKRKDEYYEAIVRKEKGRITEGNRIREEWKSVKDYWTEIYHEAVGVKGREEEEVLVEEEEGIEEEEVAGGAAIAIEDEDFGDDW
ncbi:hypothetical protein TrVE_jg6007 [Triparma verrucosa]|uniref:Uncharacterized protein n=1 Tax=Triparma verrucosa TaxID=1606542 RepID=A0A9W7EU60_9STRA|nr:hypothetical protein TrVE_jg6007 [Triparma verrucosa]